MLIQKRFQPIMKCWHSLAKVVKIQDQSIILPSVHDGRITFTSGMIFVRTIESRYASSQISL